MPNNTSGAQPLSVAQWRAKAESLFGPNKLRWRFVCPSCGFVATVSDWQSVGAPEGAVGFTCIGAFRKSPEDIVLAVQHTFQNRGGPCNYTGGGLDKLNPMMVDIGGDRPTLALFGFDKSMG